MLERTITAAKRTCSSVYLKKTDQTKKVIGHIPDTLAKVVHGLMAECQVYQVIALK